ncbi:MAG: hypothetical protein B7Y52_01600 [Sulfurovum sp. 28-43-6]|nr:MAG: hypothetical protein B7Y52_01600 [Sulfurovum sp. 28-43-6]
MTKTSLSLVLATLLFSPLCAQTVTLEDIMVTSTNKTPTSIEKTTANITVITAKEIETHGYLTVAEAIKSTAGITVSQSGGIGQQSSFFVRGADSGKVLVLLDGMRLNDPSTTNGTALLDSLITSNIAQIEIVKGASGSIWGPNASAGVINIITKENAEAGVHGYAGLTVGSYGTLGEEAQLSYKGQKLTAQVLASYLDSKSFSALAPREAEADGYTNKNLNLKLGYAINQNNQVNLSYNTLDTATQFDDAYSLDQAEDAYSHATSEQDNVALDYRFSLENYSATLHASTTLNEYAFINAYAYTKGKAILGLEYKEIDGFNQYNDFAKSQSDYTDKAIYLSNLYDITEDTLLETNLRNDSYNAFESKTSYKLGVKHTHLFLEGLTSSANYYTSYDAPSAYQLANTALGSLLQPSYTKGYDISTGYKEWLTLSYFHNTIEDMIDYVSDPLTYIGGYTNIDGQSTFSGLEAQSSYTFSPLSIVASANYTHLFDYEKEDGTDLVRRAKDTLGASLSHTTQSGMLFGVDAQYIGDRLDTDGGFPVAAQVATGNYTLWNLNFSTELQKDLDLILNAKNIFDREYQSVYLYATEGRSLYAKIKYRF